MTCRLIPVTVIEPEIMVKRMTPWRSCQLELAWQVRVTGGTELMRPEQIGISERLFSNISYRSSSPLWKVEPSTVNVTAPTGLVTKTEMFPVLGRESNR